MKRKLKKAAKKDRTSARRKQPRAAKKQDHVHALRGLFVDELKDIYWAEKALLKAIPKMIKNVTAAELRTAMEKHLQETQSHASRIEKIFGVMGLPVQSKKCDAMTGLLKEATEIMKETDRGPVRDAGIILAAQKVEHYEIATYGTLMAFARILQENEAEMWLQETLEEEKDANEKLSEVAESYINIEAAVEEEL